jgi:hypothetical protein
MTHPAIEQMLTQLSTIKERYGETAYQKAANQAAKLLIRQGGEMEKVAREVLKDIVDFEALDKEPALPKTGGLPPDQMMVEALRQQMPGIQTQAQFNLFMTAFDALRLFLNSTFLNQKEAADKAREALNQALDAASKVTELSEKLSEVPEAATSKAAEDYKQPPLQFQEYDVQKGLLTELIMITTSEQFEQWYIANRGRIDQVVSAHYRNPLFDAIRAKKASFTTPTADA